MSHRNIRRGVMTLVAAAAFVPAMQASAALSAYSQNFESLVATDPAALGADGWLIFGNVFGPGGTPYLYGYGVFPAPNAGNAFSNIDTGQGGVDQGAQQLVIFSDYNNGDHALGNLIEANVFQERSISAGDVGSTWTFQFDAKLGNLVAPTSAVAFIKTLDPNAGFATTNFLTLDTDTIPNTWGTYSIDILITPALVGQLLQFGFNSTATNYNASGVFYDNINFNIPTPGSLALLGLGGLVATRRRR